MIKVQFFAFVQVLKCYLGFIQYDYVFISNRLPEVLPPKSVATGKSKVVCYNGAVKENLSNDTFICRFVDLFVWFSFSVSSMKICMICWFKFLLYNFPGHKTLVCSFSCNSSFLTLLFRSDLYCFIRVQKKLLNINLKMY